MTTVKPANKESLHQLLRALRYFKKDTADIASLLLLTSVTTLLGFLQAWPLAVLIDSALNTQVEGSWMHIAFLALLPDDPIKRIVGLAVIALLLRLAQETISVARRLLTSRIHYNGLLRVRCELYRRLQAMHVDYHRAQPAGDALFRLTSDTLGYPAILTVIINLLFAVITLCVIVAVLAAKNTSLTLIALAVAPPLIWANVIFGKRLTERTRQAKESDSAFVTAVQRSMAAITLTQSFAREEEEFYHFGRTARQCVRAWFGIHRQEVGYALTVGAIFAVGGSLILSYGGILLHEHRLTPGELMIFMAYLGMMYDPLCQITGLGFNLQNGLAGARRVFEVLDRDNPVSDTPQALSLALQPRRVTLENVTFGYGTGEKILRRVNICVEPGTSVAFVGSSGAGKSTLLNLLPRFYDPCGGAIRLDEWDLRQLKLKDVRRHIALVSQESLMLPTTIVENIAYGRPTVSQAAIQQAARLAGAGEFIECLPEGYQTRLHDGGANLSGGQRQRIALARALLTEAPILVLDEPTSALDAYHEQLVAETLRSLKGKRTVVLVSHRIQTVSGCDLICVLHRGAIVEQGTHSQLIQRQGHYAWMARQQGNDGVELSNPVCTADSSRLFMGSHLSTKMV